MKTEVTKTAVSVLLFLMAEFFFWGILLTANAQSGNWSDERYRDKFWGKDYANTTEFVVNNETDFAQFAYMVNVEHKTFGGKTVKLRNELYLGRNKWTPIGSEEHPFSGNFSGLGNYIHGIQLNDGNSEYAGLFGYVRDGSVEGVLLFSSNITGNGNVGSIVGGADNSRVADCGVNMDVILKSNRNVGGIAGILKNGSKMLGCISYAHGDGGSDLRDIAGSTDETSKVQHSLSVGVKLFINGTTPCYYIRNQIPRATLNFGQSVETYSVSKIVAYEEGLFYEDWFLASKGRTVSFAIDGIGITSRTKVFANGNELSQTDGKYTLTMGEEDICITMEESSMEWTSGGTACKLDGSTFTVKPTGKTGEMPDYEKETDVPWAAFKNEIKTINIKDGVTHIGSFSFSGCGNINTVNIPVGVSSIGNSAFSGSNINNVYCYPAASNLQMGNQSFNDAKPRWHVFSGQLTEYQSKSSVINATLVGDLKDITLDANSDNTAILTAAEGSECNVTMKGLKLVRESFTLCVPFTIEDISKTPLAGAEICEMRNTNSQGHSRRIAMGPIVTRIEPGKLYRGKWNTAGGDLQNPVFKNVRFTAVAPQEKTFNDGSVLKGFYSPVFSKDRYIINWSGLGPHGIGDFTAGITQPAFQVYALTKDIFHAIDFVYGDYTVKCISTGKPEWWPDVEVRNGNALLANEEMVPKNSTVTFTAEVGVGYDLEWYVNGVRQNTTANTISVTVTGNTQVEARYIEHKKLTFKGSPLVRYADSKGVVDITQNFYNYSYQMERAFGYTVKSWTGSNGTNYLVDNLMQPGKLTSVTLTEDMEMTPVAALSEEDMGDNTVTVSWRFDDPEKKGLFRNHHGAGARFPYVQPTEFSSYFIDVAMTIDATNGLITNDLRKTEGNTFIGKGTRLTVPAKYGTTYKLLTTRKLSNVNIGGSDDFMFTNVGENSLATMYYYRTDIDSVVVEINEDIELIYFEATYPGGDNSMMIRPAINKAESSISTVSKTGEAGCLLYNLSDIENHGNLKITPSAYATGTSLIEMPATFDENRYMSVSFEVKEGYSFKPKSTNLYTMPVNTGKNANIRIMLIDERGNKCDTTFMNMPENVMKLDTVKPKAPSKELEMCLYGKVELRIYAYGVAGNYRLGDSIKIDGELCQTIQFPEGQKYMAHPITSAIDFDGQGLVHIDAYEVVGADPSTKLITRTALEECHMGTVMLLMSDTPGALYNIPLTRPDDSYVSGQGILKVSDGTVIGTRQHYVFAQRDGIYGFYMAAIGDPVAKGDVYFVKDSENVLVYYIESGDVPPVLEDLVLSADKDNGPSISANMGRVINSVTLGGRTFYKDGRWNIICLPFNMSGKEIKKSPLKNGTICEFDPDGSSYDIATGGLNLMFESAYEIEAGKPYLVRWNKGEDIANPIFNNVTFVNAMPENLISKDGHITFHPSYSTLDLKNSKQQLMTIRNSMSVDSCMHAMKAYFTLAASEKGLTDADVQINEESTSVSMDVEKEDMVYTIHYNNIIDYDLTTLTDYQGEGGIVQVPDSITAIIDGKDVELALRAVGANAFSSVADEITALDMSRCAGMLPLAIDRTTQDTPFYGLSESVLVYLPAGKTQPTDNVVMGGICSRLVLNDQLGFAPLYGFHADEVVLNRSTVAANSWLALCLPFDLKENMVSGELMEFAGAKKENGTLTLFLTGTDFVPAGNPAIVKWKTGKTNVLAFNNVDITTASAGNADFNKVACYGSYAPVIFTEEDHAKLFITDSRTDSYSLPGFQAYFMMDDEVTDDFNSVCVNYGDQSDFEAIEPLTGHYDVAYVLWCQGDRTLYFTVPDHKLKAGDTYNGQTITKLWKGDHVVNSPEIPAWYANNSQTEHVVFDQSFQRIRPANCSNWFYDCTGLKGIDGLYFLQTSEVTSMAHMFDRCSSLTGSLSLWSFDTSNVTDMSYMFFGCVGLEAIELNSFNTEQVTDMEWMFGRCDMLRELHLESFDTRSVISMNSMFNGCAKLAEIYMPNFNTANVTNMGYMFNRCHSLKELDLVSFNTANVTDMDHMFCQAMALTTITVGDEWTTENVEKKGSMFYSAVSLVGQKGTRYSPDVAMYGIEFACIDGGRDNPGVLWGVIDVTLTDKADNSAVLKQYGGHKVNVTYDREFSATENSDGTWTSRAFTTCLPYTKDLTENFDAGQVRVYHLAAVTEDYEFVFINETPTLYAGTPYLVVVENGTVNLNANNVRLWSMPEESVEESIVSSSIETWGTEEDLFGWWRGTFHTIENDEAADLHAFGLNSDGTWRILRNDTEAYRTGNIPTFRAFFVPLVYRDSEVYATKFKLIEAGEPEEESVWETLPDEYEADINYNGTGIQPTIHTIDGNGIHRYYDLQGRQLPGKPRKGIYIDNGIKRLGKTE